MRARPRRGPITAPAIQALEVWWGVGVGEGDGDGDGAGEGEGEGLVEGEDVDAATAGLLRNIVIL